jgi:hypothetical protein
MAFLHQFWSPSDECDVNRQNQKHKSRMTFHEEKPSRTGICKIKIVNFTEKEAQILPFRAIKNSRKVFSEFIVAATENK